MAEWHDLLFIALIIAAVCIISKTTFKFDFKVDRNAGENIKKDSDYRLQKSVMTDAELKFYKALQLCASDKHVIFTKVRIADVLSVAFPKTKESFGKWNGAFMKISQKHFDFVICDKRDMSFVCAVELNDKSHQRKDRTERDTFVIDACKQAGLPLLMQAWQPEYNLDELYLSLNTTIDEGKKNKADSDNTDNDISHMPNIHAER